MDVRTGPWLAPALRGALLAAGCTVALLGCGGGDSSSADSGGRDVAGGGSGGNENGVLSITLDPPQAIEGAARVRLRWHRQGDARTFQVFVQRTADDVFEPIVADLTGNSARFARGAAWRYDFPSAKVRVRACDGTQQCVDSNEQPLEAALVGGVASLQFADPTQFVRWGREIALSADGRTLAVSARNDGLREITEGDVNTGVGSVTMFHRDDDGQWQRIVEIHRQGIDEFEYGLAIALSGDGKTLAVGTPHDLAPRTPGGVEPVDGAVHVYTRDAQDQWTRQSVVRVAPGPFDFFVGQRVALSHDGNRLLVGAFQSTYVFDRSGTSWQQGSAFEQVGPLALSANGSTLAIGWGDSDYNDVELGPAIPVYVYEACSCSPGWRRAAILRTPEPSPDGSGFVYDSFGTSLSFTGDGNTLAIGAPGYSRAYLFGKGSDGWTQRAVLSSPAEGDRMAFRVALSRDGQQLAVSALGLAANTPGLRRNHRAGTTPNPGSGESQLNAMYFFERTGGAWERTAATVLTTVETSSFARSIALSADAQTYAAGVLPRLKGQGDVERVPVY
jgi:hypothetical protein